MVWGGGLWVALTVSLPVAIATLAFYIGYRLFEDYLLTPRIMGGAVKGARRGVGRGGPGGRGAAGYHRCPGGDPGSRRGAPEMVLSREEGARGGEREARRGGYAVPGGAGGVLRRHGRAVPGWRWPDQLVRPVRVRDLLAAARALNDQWDTDLAVQRLSSLNLMTSGKVSKLSGGQQAQLALTLALARRPRLLLLDEPLASLDPLARQEVLGWLMTCVAEDGLSVVFSSHVIAELERVATYLVVLSQGQVQVAATVDSLLDSHLALTGPAEEADRLAGQVPVITAQQAGRQAQVLARTDAAPPGWAARPVTMEELVLGYLREPSARVLPRLQVAR